MGFRRLVRDANPETVSPVFAAKPRARPSPTTKRRALDDLTILRLDSRRASLRYAVITADDAAHVSTALLCYEHGG